MRSKTEKGAFLPRQKHEKKMKIMVVRPPRILRPLLRKICGVKKGNK